MIFLGIFKPVEILKDETGGCERKQKLSAALLVFAVTAFMGAVLMPVVFYLASGDRYEVELNVSNIILAFGVALLSELAAVALFFVLSAFFQKGAGFGRIVSTWGYSCIPNLICMIAWCMIGFGAFNFFSNQLVGFLINTFFIMLLVWKAIFYFMEMKYVLKVSVRELIIMTVIVAAVYVPVMMAGFAAGIQIPVL
ncbi:MAG: hypothetical protein HGA22_04975 [Clostridiales bacterium]|nr:hypothetical protein [Clostridiales bacterium]